jgi:hypothetical protein
MIESISNKRRVGPFVTTAWYIPTLLRVETDFRCGGFLWK